MRVCYYVDGTVRPITMSDIKVVPLGKYIPRIETVLTV